jgi:DNA (cytosine-5)-methyltransferase 1
VAKSRWAIEYDAAAAEAFKKNYPESDVMCNNCNVLLRVSGLCQRGGVRA